MRQLTQRSICDWRAIRPTRSTANRLFGRLLRKCELWWSRESPSSGLRGSPEDNPAAHSTVRALQTSRSFSGPHVSVGTEQLGRPERSSLKEDLLDLSSVRDCCERIGCQNHKIGALPPPSIVPVSLRIPRASAPLRVAIRKTSSGGMPAASSNSSSRWNATPGVIHGFM